MKYNYQLQTLFFKKFKVIENSPTLYYYTIKLNNSSNLKQFRFVIKKSLRDIRNEYYLTDKQFKYLGVFETREQLGYSNYLFEEEIKDLGLHIHLFVSPPKWVPYESIRYSLVKNIGQYIMKNQNKISLLIGNEKTEYFDIKSFSKYHSKQFWDRNKDFIISNINTLKPNESNVFYVNF